METKDRRFLDTKLKGLISVFPFNEYEYILTFLRDRNLISFLDYEKLRKRYVSSNKYLSLYGIAPRVFGQIWGEEHLISMDNRLKKGSKQLDPEYDGQYDLWVEKIRIEVKASRSRDTKKKSDLTSKALRYNSKEQFWMNFQQLKPDVCDVFIFIGVWVNKIVYWVLSNKEVKDNKYLSHQHRGGIEYQIGITDKNILDFDKYRVSRYEIVDEILRKVKL